MNPSQKIIEALDLKRQILTDTVAANRPTSALVVRDG